MSTNSVEALLTFNLSPSVQGVGGNFFATDASFGIVPAIIGVTLADGSSYVGYAASPPYFVGFYSTGAAISSISVSVAGDLPAGTNFATVDNLYFAFEEYDADGDGILNSTDNCPTIANPSQADCNTNGIGDACESFIDCNTNTIPDYCDIAGGVPDLNLDTIPDTCQCLADLVINHEVNGADLGALLAFWGPVNPALLSADINRDGVVNGEDLGYLLNAWGPCTN
jgi:hypothetical protein